MENVISAKTKWLRGLAFAFLALCSILTFFQSSITAEFRILVENYLTLRTWEPDSHDVWMKSHMYSGIITSTLLCIPEIICFIFLICIASNKATRTAALLMLIVDVVYPINYALGWGIPDDGAVHIIAVITVYAITYLFPVYGFSLICRNGNLSPKARRWVAILVIPYAVYIIDVLFNIGGIALIDEIKPNAWDYDYMWYASSMYSGVWWMIWKVFAIVAYFRFIFSPAYDGNWRLDAKCSMTPMNKYVLGTLLAAFIGFTLIIAFYLICL